MPVSDWKPIPQVYTGRMWTAAEQNDYLRNNQQVLFDGLTKGHGQGSNVDMVDDRHAYQMEGWDAYIDLDGTTPAGWVTIAEGDRRRVGWFEFATANHEYLRLFAGWMYGAQYSPTGAVLREWAYTRYWRNDGSSPEYWGIRGVRIIYPSNDPTYGTAKLQVWWAGAGSMRIYQYTPNTAGWTRYGGQEAWGLVTPPVQEDPTGYGVADVLVPGNGSWRLARAMSGTGTIGWMSAAQKQGTFVDAGHSGLLGYNFANFLDGSTGNYGGYIDGPGSIGCTSGYVIFDAQQPIVLDSIQAYISGESASMRVDASHDQTNWTYLGTVNAGTGWRTLTFAARSARYWKVTFCGYGYGNSYYHEVNFRNAASLIIRGAPMGAAVSLLNASGSTLEARRNTAWERDAPLMFSADPSQVDAIAVTRPDGATAWLKFPIWAVDGWDSSGYQVLALYQVT